MNRSIPDGPTTEPFAFTVTTEKPQPARSSPVRPLAAVVLLAGAVRLSELRRAAGRPILDLPIARGHTLGAEWLRRMAELRRELSRPDLPLVITANAIAGNPQSIAGSAGVSVRLDSEEPRGSGGALRDLALEHDRNACFLVASGHSLPRASLFVIFEHMSSFNDDIVIHCDADNRPTGMFLIRCGTLVGLPARGFVDLKEQALPNLAAQFKIRVLRDSAAAPVAIRSLASYHAALRAYAASQAGVDAVPAEDWMCTFTVTEDGATVDASAKLHDTIVLSGGRVGARANVVRSLVGPGGTVAPGAESFDELLPLGEQNK